MSAAGGERLPACLLMKRARRHAQMPWNALMACVLAAQQYRNLVQATASLDPKSAGVSSCSKRLACAGVAPAHLPNGLRFPPAFSVILADGENPDLCAISWFS